MRKKSARYNVKTFAWDTKAADAAGKFSGYGSVFGNVDSYGEIVAKGAFKDSLAEVKAAGRSIPVLWQHNPSDPIGDWSTLSEDDHGLYGEGQLWLAEAPNALRAQKGMQTKAITGLSIGYYVLKSSYDEKNNIRTLTEIDLLEVSVVTNPANSAARVDAVKAMIAHGTLPSLKEFEEILREAGFSKSQAAVIANRGLKHLLSEESAGKVDDQASAVAALLQGFSLKI